MSYSAEGDSCTDGLRLLYHLPIRCNRTLLPLLKQIDLPGQKAVIWEKLRADLIAFAPIFAEKTTLLCPTCLRELNYDDFSIEHIAPRQAVADDPPDVKSSVARDIRSGITLLCSKQLIHKGKTLSANGCNGWKGKHFDNSIKQLVHDQHLRLKVTNRHQVALFAMGYLALFRQFGYQIALSEAGLLMRRQFFHPDTFLREIPTSCQLYLMGAKPEQPSDVPLQFWQNPFSIDIEEDTALVVFRNYAFRLPLSHDPTKPFAKLLAYVPQRQRLRLDFRSTV